MALDKAFLSKELCSCSSDNLDGPLNRHWKEAHSRKWEQPVLRSLEISKLAEHVDKPWGRNAVETGPELLW